MLIYNSTNGNQKRKRVKPTINVNKRIELKRNELGMTKFEAIWYAIQCEVSQLSIA